MSMKAHRFKRLDLRVGSIGDARSSDRRHWAMTEIGMNMPITTATITNRSSQSSSALLDTRGAATEALPELTTHTRHSRDIPVTGSQIGAKLFPSTLKRDEKYSLRL